MTGYVRLEMQLTGFKDPKSGGAPGTMPPPSPGSALPPELSKSGSGKAPEKKPKEKVVAKRDSLMAVSTGASSG